ncbi:MAG TPA: hypothetical protein VFZ65_16515 [Planctomycetota bacterium]|nr:hypothetical protein [Planctomycetota bacterium]
MPAASKAVAIAAALFASSSLIAQVTLPPHTAIYNGFTRGYNFISSIPFNIIGLELPPNAQQAGDTASFMVRVNNIEVLRNVGGVVNPLATAIPILPGDSVDILGNWSPAATGNFTAHNSYSASYTLPGFSTLIEGVAHDLRRAGWQWDIGDPSYASGAYLAPTSGQLGRVFIYTSPAAGTIATNTTLGSGCVRQYTSFYENFATPAAFDLAGTAVTMIPNAGGYLVTTAGSFLPIGSVQAVPTALALGDDAGIVQPLTVGSFMGPAGPWTSLYVISNGLVCQAAGNSLVAAPAVSTLLGNPQTAFYTQADFDPIGGAGAGTIWFEENASVITVTWDNVASWNNPGSQNTFQMQLYPSGVVTIAWTALAAVGSNGGVLVGYSPGGASLDPGNTDLSALGAGSLMLTATDNPELQLAATTRPVLGTNWNLTCSNIPATAVFGLTIFGASDPGIPDLFFLGMPTCGLRASLDVINGPWFPGGPTYNYSFAVPATPASLVGFQLFTETAVFQVPPINAFGAITSNGIKGTLGDI